jgi:hypothetical protein
MSNEGNRARIEILGQGSGEIGDDAIEARAVMIARLNGRATPNEHDRQAALDDLSTPIPTDSSEVEIAEGDRPDAGSPPSSVGVQAEAFHLDDEENLPEALVMEGIEEAEQETRFASAEDPQEEE